MFGKELEEITAESTSKYLKALVVYLSESDKSLEVDYFFEPGPTSLEHFSIKCEVAV